MNATHPLKTAERAAHAAVQAALLARDAIDFCGSPEWREAHKVAGEKCAAWRIAQVKLYTAARDFGAYHKAVEAGLEFAPYWFGPLVAEPYADR